ncbi:MAG: PaaI family thioesterase [Microbacteriaceae bacterium]|nr:PaaI family thioesterase [Microbacteriaceae bacterium]
MTSRTLTWADPGAVLERASGLTGIEMLRALRDGVLPPPPMAVTMNASIREVEEGRVVFECVPGEEHYNPLGTVHGGYACTALDTVTGCAAQTTLPAGVGYTSIEIAVKYLRPITLRTGPLRVVGTVTKPGRRVIFAEGAILDAGGTTLATASSSLLVLGG